MSPKRKHDDESLKKFCAGEFGVGILGPHNIVTGVVREISIDNSRLILVSLIDVANTIWTFYMPFLLYAYTSTTNEDSRTNGVWNKLRPHTKAIGHGEVDSSKLHWMLDPFKIELRNQRLISTAAMLDIIGGVQVPKCREFITKLYQIIKYRITCRDMALPIEKLGPDSSWLLKNDCLIHRNEHNCDIPSMYVTRISGGLHMIGTSYNVPKDVFLLNERSCSVHVLVYQIETKESIRLVTHLLKKHKALVQRNCYMFIDLNRLILDINEYLKK